MKIKEARVDVAVIGGGLAGLCAAVAAARSGARTCLVQDRPVLGGNSSSEIRVTPQGAANFHAYARETGIISELLIEERARNHEQITGTGWTNSVWDMVMYDMAVATPNLTLYVNTSVTGVEMASPRLLRRVTGRVANAETLLHVFADTFIDCTGDGVLANLAGCEWRMGSEARDEFGEPHAPVQASEDVMGSSIHFKAIDTGSLAPFSPPDWAIVYNDPDFFYKRGRDPHDIRGGYWWIEIGVPWHTIHDAEDIRHELTRHVFGVWDWIKNKDPNTISLAANYALDWIGQVPGKRESRRIIGDYLMTEHDMMSGQHFRDEIAFGGWFLDLHTPGGLLAPISEPTAAASQGEDARKRQQSHAKSYCAPYRIPLGICLSKDVDNLMMAGRNVSVTHAALGSIRVMGTTAVMGQAVGTAAALAACRGMGIKAYAAAHAQELQQRLLRDGCFLLGARNEEAEDAARSAKLSASSEALLYGIGPDSRDSGTQLLQRWTDTRPQYWRPAPTELPAEPLNKLVAQYIAIGTTRVDRIAVLLVNKSDRQQHVRISLTDVRHLWDYRLRPERYASAQLEVPPGGPHWVAWDIYVDALRPGSYARLDIVGNGDIAWLRGGGIVPGHVSAEAFIAGEGFGPPDDDEVDFPVSGGLRSRKGALSFQIEPPQPCFGAANAVNGVARPYDYPNLWRSDPARPLPQWLQLDWDEAVELSEVRLVFPGHLLEEYMHYPPFYRDPQCPKDYRILAWESHGWTELARISNNYQRQRIHQLDHPVTTTRLRVVVDATNGDPAAAIYEIRCYTA